MRPLLLALAATAALSGCVSAPEIEPPAPPPRTWLGQADSAATAPEDSWWRASVSDPLMIDLIERAGEINSVDEARARWLEARARVGAARAGLLPSIAASGQAQRANPDIGAGYTIEQGALTADIDLDVFGANRNRARALAASANAQEALLRLARINARRNIADLYVALRNAQTQTIAARAAESAAEESLALADGRYRTGLDSGLSEAQARAARDAARARAPQFAQAETEARLLLEALLGLAPGALASTFSAPALAPRVNADAMLAAPASMLANHPDIEAAEARLARAGFNAAAARADLWPRLSLEAALASVNAPAGFSGAFVDGTQAGASLTAPLFNFGRLRALARAEGRGAEAEAAVLRQTVLDRWADVEIQRARLANAEIRAAAQDAAFASARDTAMLAQARYRAGLTGFIDVLTADSALYDAQAAKAEADAEQAQAAIALAAALGLGQAP